MRALVTGGAGFVGANLVRRLLADGHAVTAVVRPGAELWRLGAVGDLEIVELDLRDAGAVETRLAAAAPEWVFHLAAHGAYSWQQEVEPILATNLIGTALLAEAAARQGVAAFVHAGSSSEYGFKDHAPGEDELPEPNSAYAVGKAGATLYCSYVGRRDMQRFVTLRLYSVYGPWEEPGRLMPTLVVRGLQGELPPLAAPDTARDFVFVDDVVDAFIRAATAEEVEPGSVYNVASGRQTTLRELVDHATEVFEIRAEPEWSAYKSRSWDTAVWFGNPGAAERDLGWRATTPVGAGLRMTADWLAAGGAELRGRYDAG